MAYPPQPGYPGVPYHPGQIDPAGKPSAVTTVIAAVLSILGAMAAILQILASVAAMRVLPDWLVVWPIVALLLLAFLVTGAVLAFMRKRAAWMLMTAGSVCHIAWMVLSAAVISNSANYAGTADEQSFHVVIQGGIVAIVIFSIPAIATIVLSVIPPTRQYLSWHPGGGAYPGPGQHAPYQYGPPGYGPQPPQQQWGPPPPQW